MPKNNSAQNVALITWWNYHNYGTALQVVATYKKLVALGHKVDVINYIPSGKRYSTNADGDRATDWSELPRVDDEKREQQFENFLNQHLTFTKKCVNDEDFEKLNDKYDIFISGSDQVWSPIIFDERYFLDFVKNNRKKVSYASSFGALTVENDFVRERMTDLMSQYAHISTRELRGADLVKNLIDRKAETVLDPTLLLTRDEWQEVIPKTKKLQEKYILCYFLGDNENQWKHAAKISKQTGLPIKILPIFGKDSESGEFQMGVGPAEFFNLINGAETILTDSFHAVIFSIICRKSFYVFERFRNDDKLSQNSRIHDFLKMMKLEKRIVGYDEQTKEKYDFNFNFGEIEKIIAEKREKSIEYLRRSLIIDQPLVSVIVPVYNVEKYIKQCLDSISAQTYENLEIIVVDDGTPDKSAEIAEQCARKDHRMKIIHQKNCGLSIARNTGVSAARNTGVYIVFVDSDDALAPDYVEYMVSLIENTGTDIARTLSPFTYRNLEQINFDRFEKITSKQQLLNMEYYNDGIEVWNKIYRKSFLDRYKLKHFDVIEFGEGHTFNTNAILRTDFIGVGRRRVYYYRHNFDSAVRKFVWDRRRKTLAIALEYRKKFFLKSQDKDLIKSWRCHNWSDSFYLYRGILSLDNPEFDSDLKKYHHYCRTKIFGVLLADRKRIGKNEIKKAIKIFISPKRIARIVNEQEAKTNQQLYGQIKAGKFDLDLMPWEMPKSKKIEVDAKTAEIENLRAENLRLNAELNNFLSIKRSARLLAGNIKRRILYGKKRGLK